MLFTHDTEDALAAMTALVNTAGEPDTLTTIAELEAFLAQFTYTGRIDRDAAELAELRELRVRLRQLFNTDEEGLVAHVNALLRESQALPHVVRHDHFGWHLHATDDDQPLATRIALESAMARVDVLRADQTQRLRRCEAPGCAGVLVDLSRNGSRRFCSTTCGNRVAAAAYRARKAEQVE